MTKALLIVDIQNDYFPGGRMELVGSPQASLQARSLLEAFRARGLPVFHVQHLSTRPGATTASRAAWRSRRTPRAGRRRRGRRTASGTRRSRGR